jgi:hypothetical protein
MLALLFLNLALGTPEALWHDDYATAYRQAIRERKDLLIHFRDDDRLDGALRDLEVMQRLARRFVSLRVPTSYEYKGERLLDCDFLADMLGRPGLAIVSLHDEQLPIHNQAISAHPLVRSRYGWAPDYGPEQLKIILDLPATATLSQRSMIYAVRVHPERPQSIMGEAHPAFLAHAERHSVHQASLQNQHHADLLGAMANFRSNGVPLRDAGEVVAESWGRIVGGENVLEAAFSCVDAWRHSSGHWSAVSRPHRYYGYDVARGANGTWYATGIFGD